MRVRVQTSGLEPAQELGEASNIVIYDDFDQPILVAQSIERGAVIVSRCTDPDFTKLLASLGIGLNASCKLVG